MCGIVGIIHGNNKIDPQMIVRMNNALKHRGPDGDGFWRSNDAQLGHTRLRILDLSEQADQPMVHDSGKVIVYNGEIYNYIELRRELTNKTWKTTGDTEVLLDAFSEWDESCLHRLNGMFAFAVWDENNLELFAARDRFGIKPFFYTEFNGSFLFASEIKAFFEAGVPARPNYNKIGEFLRWGALDYSTESWFEGIHNLSPGHYLKYKNGKLTIKRYYWLPEHIDESRDISEHDIIYQYSELIKNSIKLQTRSDREIGVHLSGGVDSSVVTALTSQEYSGKLKSYTFGYNEEQFDERRFAKSVSECLNVENHSSILTGNELETWLIRVIKEEDEPFTSFRQLSHHKLYSDFKDGSTVILEASGGDELGAGYSYYLWPWYLDRVKETGPFNAKNELIDMISTIGGEGSNVLNFILGASAYDSQPGVCTSDGMPFLEPDILNSDFVTEYAGIRPEYERPFKSHLRNAQYIDLMYAKLPRGLRYVERASMACGREARLPLLDHRIVELCFSASSLTKISNNNLRKFMKEIAANILPENILEMNKRSVADPQKAWLRSSFRDIVIDIFSSQRFKDRGIVDVKKSLRSFDNFCKADPYANSLGIFQLLIVEFWFRTLIDNYQAAI